MVYARFRSVIGRRRLKNPNRVKSGSGNRARRPANLGADQSPSPGFGEKYFSNLPSSPSKSLASGGDSFFWVMFGQLLAYSVFTSSHFSRPGSVSGLMASAGHSGSHTPQSMHSSG